MKNTSIHFLIFTLTFLLATFLCITGCSKNSDELDKPNVVFVLIDDMGYGDLSMCGQESFSTPNIDKMAAEGITFSNFYAGSTVCAPSRASLLTGKHTGHTSVRGNLPAQLIGDNEMVIAKVMKKAGYNTGIIGKWGIGHPPPIDDPHRKGFDYFFGYINMWHAHNCYPEFLYCNGEKIKLRNKLKLENGKNPWKDSPEGTGIAEVKSDYVPYLLDQEALDFIERNKDEPFFLLMAYNTPHANSEKKPDGFEVPSYGKFVEKDWPNQEKGFAKMMVDVDQSMRKILVKLKETGIDDNTIVFFCSDNGPESVGGHDIDFFNSNGQFRGMKRDLYDGGIRTPFIVRWPKVIKPGQKSEYVGAFWDVLPTLADIVNVNIPKDIDGISFLPILEGNPKKQKQHDYLYWEFYELGGKQAILKDNWKAVKLHVSDKNPVVFELYNIKLDPGEKNNVADKYPEVVKELMVLFDEAHEDFSVVSFYNKVDNKKTNAD